MMPAGGTPYGRQPGLPAGQDDKGNCPGGHCYQRDEPRGLCPSGLGRPVDSRDEPPRRAA